MTIAEAVLDSSAIVAALRREPGGDRVRDMGRLWTSSVNLAEVVHVLLRLGHDLAALDAVPFDVQPLDQVDARHVGLLLNGTRAYGLSLGDCACLALARRLKLPAVTADRVWAELDLGIEVVLIR